MSKDRLVAATGSVGWVEVAVAMDRGLRGFAEAVRPCLARAGCEGLGTANLMFLLSIDGPSSGLADVIRRGKYLGSNASYALKALQRAGLVERRPDDRDRRSAVLIPTDRGMSLLADIRASLPGGTGSAAATTVAAVAVFEDACRGNGPATGNESDYLRH